MFPILKGTPAASAGRNHSGSGGAASYAYPSMAYASMAAGGGGRDSDDAQVGGHILTPRTAHALAAATRGPVSPSAARRSSGGPASVARHASHAAAAPSLSQILQMDHPTHQLDFGVESHPPSVSSPVRSLRTPAGLALSYEQGRNAHAMRRDLMTKESPTSPSHATSATAAAPASSPAESRPQPGSSYLPSLISHVHFTPLMPLPVHYGLTATLNRTSPTHQPRALNARSSATGAAELSGNSSAALNFASPNKMPPGVGGPLVPLLPLHAEEKEASPAATAAAAPVPAPPIPLQPMHPIGGPAADKAMTAVQRQRAYRAALLTKALSKPAVVHSLDRRRVDDLKSLLNKRAQKETLLKRKILTDESSLASRATQLTSTKEALSNFFGGKRPAAAVLTKQNILRDQEAASEREASKSRLSSFLMKRPSVIDASVAAKMTPKRITFQTASEAEAEEAAAAAAKSAGAGGADESPKLEPVGDDTVEEGEEADEEEEGATKSSAEKKLEASAAAAAAAALSGTAGSKSGGAASGSGPAVGGARGGRKFSIFTSAKMASTSGNTLNKLSSFLENRPGYEDLMKKNIMMTKPGSNIHANPAAAAHARKMSFSNLKNSVSKLLETRPTMSDLKSMAKNLLNGMVRNQMARDAAAEEMEKERQERLIQEHHATAVDGGVPVAPSMDGAASSSSAATGTDGVTSNGISLEALQSNNLKIDELFAERRRLTEQKLRLKEVEEPGGLYMSGSNERGQTGFQGLEFVGSLQCLMPLVRETVLQVACGFEHTLVRTASGAAYAYGKNSYGQLGLGDTLDRDQPYSMHFRGSPLFKKNVVWIAAGEKTSGIVAKEGEVFTMGYVKTGALGSGINPDSIDPHDLDPMGSACCRATPFALPELKNKRIHRLALGGSHGAALDSSGRLYTWSEQHMRMRTSRGKRGCHATQPGRRVSHA